MGKHEKRAKMCLIRLVGVPCRVAYLAEKYDAFVQGSQLHRQSGNILILSRNCIEGTFTQRDEHPSMQSVQIFAEHTPSLSTSVDDRLWLSIDQIRSQQEHRRWIGPGTYLSR
jgi:hypothetical protein